MRKAIPVLLTALFLIAVACGKPTTWTASTADSSKAASGPAWPGKMTLTTDPAQPESEKDTTFRVILTDTNGHPVTGARVQADLEMPRMDMGKNVVQLADKGNGVYEGKGQFTMGGPWNVIVTATKAGTSGEQKFDIVVRR